MAVGSRAAHLCKIGGLFSRCKLPAVESCQYCGRDFCRDHTHYLEGIQAVCTRKKCRRKHDDLAAHEEYKLAATRRNLLGHCGEDECRAVPALTCSFCEAHYCVEHVRPRTWGFRDGQASFDRTVSLCQHCWGRRKVWQ